jgi:beta-glucosidase-like glycosyl hydrolase
MKKVAVIILVSITLMSCQPVNERLGIPLMQFSEGLHGLQGTGEQKFDENHILATAKHYVGYPENRRGINAGFSDMSERCLREVYLPPFEATVKEAGVGSVMLGHQDYNGVPCHMNTWLIEEVLRKESDVVVLAVGGSRLTCGEGVDRSELELFGV